MRVKILGKFWDLRFASNLANRGDCDDPRVRGKAIRIAAGLGDEELAEVAIHECLHAAGWHIDEEFVEQFAADVARVLHRLGYRKEQV
jgi:hypothetical protein